MQFKPSGNKHAICTHFLMAIVFVMVIGDLLNNQSSTVHILLLIIHIATPSDNRLYVAMNRLSLYSSLNI